MNDVEIIDIDKNSQIFILNIEKNMELLNESIIPNEQLQMIQKYKEDKDRTKRVLARSFLFNYCKNEYNLEDFSFKYTNNQKPKFKNSELSFSISYSKDIIGIALSQKQTIGLDIEYAEASIVSKEVAFEFMNDAQLLIFTQLSEKKKDRYFYEIWTSKESFLKATGSGLLVNPKSIINNKGKFFYFKDYIICFTTV